MTFKFSFNSTPFHHEPIEKVIDRLERLGYDAIEINASVAPFAEPHIPPDMNQKDMERMVNAINQSKLEVSSISAHFDLIHADLAEQKKVIEYTKQSIMLAKQLNNTIVHGYSGNKPDGMSEEEAWDIVTSSVDEIVSFAEKEGIKYAFEPAARRFINNGETIGKLKQKVTSGILYVNLDPGNLVVADDSVEEFIHTFNRDIVHVHIKDGQKLDGKIEFPPLGQGKVDFKHLIKTLKDINYKGYLSVEYEADRFGYQEELEKVPQWNLNFMKDLVEHR